MKEETFRIKSYGKSELAIKYFPDSTKQTALKKFRFWLNLNPRLRHLIGIGKSYTPKQVQLIVNEIGEPY